MDTVTSPPRLYPKPYTIDSDLINIPQFTLTQYAHYDGDKGLEGAK